MGSLNKSLGITKQMVTPGSGTLWDSECAANHLPQHPGAQLATGWETSTKLLLYPGRGNTVFAVLSSLGVFAGSFTARFAVLSKLRPNGPYVNVGFQAVSGQLQGTVPAHSNLRPQPHCPDPRAWSSRIWVNLPVITIPLTLSLCMWTRTFINGIGLEVKIDTCTWRPCIIHSIRIKLRLQGAGGKAPAFHWV